MTKPTLPEIQQAMAKAGLPEIEAHKFWNHYEGNGWRVGKSPMKSWPHAVNNWKIRFIEYGGTLLATAPVEGVPKHILDFHTIYEQATGFSVSVSCRVESWKTFIAFRNPPFTHDDLRVVVRQIRFEQRTMGSKRSLDFRNLIGQPSVFEEDLSRARAALRPRQSPVHTVRTGVTERIIANPGTGDATRSMVDVIAAMRVATG